MEPKPEITPAERCVLAAVAIYALVFLTQVHCAPAQPVPADAQVGGSALPPIVYAPVRPEELMPAGLGTDGGVPRLGIPPGPSALLKTPPCNREAEEYPINGNCWQATPRKPPCGEWLREHGGTCYRALPRQPPVSGQ
jgi:hypothetical protein